MIIMNNEVLSTKKKRHRTQATQYLFWSILKKVTQGRTKQVWGVNFPVTPPTSEINFNFCLRISSMRLNEVNV